LVGSTIERSRHVQTLLRTQLKIECREGCVARELFTSSLFEQSRLICDLCRSKAALYTLIHLRMPRHTRRHPTMPYLVSRHTAPLQPVHQARNPLHTPNCLGCESSRSRPNRIIRIDSPIQSKCLPKSQTSSSSSRSAGAKMLAVRLTISLWVEISRKEEGEW
jgi:hypothetical protein